jgi:hypothetical protein
MTYSTLYAFRALMTYVFRTHKCAHEENTEEENNCYVVFKCSTDRLENRDVLRRVVFIGLKLDLQRLFGLHVHSCSQWLNETP